MRASSGSLSASEVESYISASKLSKLPGHILTTREMNLDNRVVNLLKNRGIIKCAGRKYVPRVRNGKPNGGEWLRAWKVGNCWRAFAEKRGWA